MEWDYNSFGFGHVEIAVVGDFPTDARRHLHMNLKFRGEVSDRDVDDLAYFKTIKVSQLL